MKKILLVLSLMIICSGNFAKSNSLEYDLEPTTLLMSRTGPNYQKIKDPSSFLIRTNILYDAVMLPTLGIEWRISQDYSIKLDGSWSNWGSETDKIQKMWMISPEFRHYLGNTKCFYVGLGGNFGHANIYQYILGNMIKSNIGYDGNLWGVDLSPDINSY
jgi:Protein of unknown function (DUF3575).